MNFFQLQRIKRHIPSNAELAPTRVISIETHPDNARTLAQAWQSKKGLPLLRDQKEYAKKVKKGAAHPIFDGVEIIQVRRGER